MAKNIVRIVTIVLILTHLCVLYLWIFDWKKLVTEIGLFSWIGSIIFGLIIYSFNKMLVSTEKSILVLNRMIFVTTIITILLGIFALFIELITNSMP